MRANRFRSAFALWLSGAILAGAPHGLTAAPPPVPATNKCDAPPMDCAAGARTPMVASGVSRCDVEGNEIAWTTCEYISPY